MRFILIFSAIFGQIFSFTFDANPLRCPRECICEVAPLRAAPFVLAWMTSWGEDDLPEVHANEVLDAGLMVSSGTAADAEVDVDVRGLHATCSLQPSTNLTTLLSLIPKETMVLSILQAPGCNFTTLDGGSLVNLKSLIALHLQGYARVEKKQVSGFSPNSISEFIAHKKLLEKEIKMDGQKMIDLRFALAEDALQALKKLELLDLQYVRLVASRENRRSRRYSKEPISSTIVVDMPLTQFLRFADGIESFHLPPHLQYLNPYNPLLDGNNMDNDIIPTSNKHKLQRRIYVSENGDIVVGGLNDRRNFKKEKEIETNEIEVVPYEIYKAETQSQLAPFKHLKKLKYLRVAHARLDKVGPELLEGLHQLHTLTLEYNRIKIIPAAMFTPTPRLRHLSLAYNNILLLEASSLEGLSKLLTIDLDNNHISIISPASFPSLPSLTTIRLRDNPITHLLPDAFISINLTENIVLGSLNIATDIHEHSFRFLNRLNDLVLNNVNRDSLQKTLLSGMPAVQNLEIHGKVHKIDYDAFSTTPNLKSLNLSHCHLDLLSVDAFYGLRPLLKLDLSYNALSTLSPGIFDYLMSLKELYLHHNLLSTLPLGIFIPIPAKLIQLYNNPWFCSCDLLQLRPSITNKVSRGSQVSCHWDEKLSTVCSKTDERLVYDSRVAPLCYEPKELKGNDVYHAALRHLKCTKYHWDPRLIQTEQPKQEIIRTIKPKIIVKQSKDIPYWLPLIDFTPEPIGAEELFEVVEKEGLVEVFDHTTPRSSAIVSEVSKIRTKKISIAQNDQPLLINRFHHIDVQEHREQKRKLKVLMKTDALKRRRNKKLFLQRMMEREKKIKKRKGSLRGYKKKIAKSKHHEAKPMPINLYKKNYLKGIEF